MQILLFSNWLILIFLECLKKHAYKNPGGLNLARIKYIWFAILAQLRKLNSSGTVNSINLDGGSSRYDLTEPSLGSEEDRAAL